MFRRRCDFRKVIGLIVIAQSCLWVVPCAYGSRVGVDLPKVLHRVLTRGGTKQKPLFEGSANAFFSEKLD